MGKQPCVTHFDENMNKFTEMKADDFKEMSVKRKDEEMNILLRTNTYLSKCVNF